MIVDGEIMHTQVIAQVNQGQANLNLTNTRPNTITKT